MWVTLYNPNDKKYYHYHKGQVAVTDTLHYDKSIFKTTQITSNVIHQTKIVQPPIQKHVNTIVMNTRDLCIDKLQNISSSNPQYLLVFTDIFYNDIYKNRQYILNANYICNNSIDFYYFTRYLKLNASFKTDEITSESTVIINPPQNYDRNKYKNAIYTTFLTHMDDDFIDGICNDNRKLYIHLREPTDNNIKVLSEDFIDMSDEYIYTHDPKIGLNNTFRIVFGRLMTNNQIYITRELYTFIKQLVNKANLFFNIIVSNNFKNEDTYNVDKNIALYQWQSTY